METIDHSKCKNVLHFEFLINFIRKVKKPSPFRIDIWFCEDHDQPFSMDFLGFEDEKKKDHESCNHFVAQHIDHMFFMKNIPKGLKPFSMTISICPKCSSPTAFSYEIYPGDFSKWPRHKDLHKYGKGKKKLPKSITTEMQRI